MRRPKRMHWRTYERLCRASRDVKRLLCRNFCSCSRLSNRTVWNKMQKSLLCSSKLLVVVNKTVTLKRQNIGAACPGPCHQLFCDAKRSHPVSPGRCNTSRKRSLIIWEPGGNSQFRVMQSACFGARAARAFPIAGKAVRRSSCASFAGAPEVVVQSKQYRSVGV